MHSVFRTDHPPGDTALAHVMNKTIGHGLGDAIAGASTTI